MPVVGYALSFAQQRLWFLDQLSPGTAFYNIPLVLDLDGPLEVGTIEQTLREIVRRHEPLRTIFPADGGLPRQEVLPPDSFELAIDDLSENPIEQHEAAFDGRLLEEARRPFDLSRGPIFRATLVRLAATHHVLILTVHHIAFDGWSSGVFFRELSTLYDAFSKGAPSPLPDLPIRYVDFAAEQRERMTGDTLARQMAYWKDQLRPPRQMLSVPTDRPRPPVQSFRGQREYELMPEALINRLQELSRREGVTLFMTLLASYATFLHRLSGQDDILIGTPIANRTRQEIEPLIGFFANSLALRMNVSGADTLRAVVGQARRVAIGAYANQDLPFERIVEELKPERNLSHSPILQTFLVLDNNPHGVGDGAAAGNITIRRRQVSTGTSKFDMSLVVRRAGSGRRIGLETSADLFDASTGARMLHSYCRFLERFADHLDTPVERLPFLDEEPRRRSLAESPASASRAGGDEMRAKLLDEWAGRTAPYPSDQTIAQLFEAQARRTPEATAVVSEEAAWTYRQLNERANQLAHALRRRLDRTAGAAGATQSIGVCLERSTETIVVLLAILKAGGAYVPLDPTHPPARLAALAERGQLNLIVTRSALSDRLIGVAVDLFLVDREQAGIAAEAAFDPSHTQSAESLAYVLFTSGTTGTPKSVGVPHRAIARLVFGLPEIPLGEGHTVLHLSPLAFDASTFEIWGPLLHGGRIAIAPDLLLMSASLEAFVLAHDVTVMWLTASLFNAVIDDRPRALAAVRYLLTGGEALSVPHVARAIAALPDTRIFNGYGPTEATTFTCCHPIAAADAEGTRSIPIGRPLLNTRVYVLGPDRELVAQGEPGELWIGGDGLARGYLDDGDLTRSRFVRDPFADGAAARMYQTGDRVRFNPDGTLEFLGRLDEQIKLRGFRIEPGEVEAALVQHPRVARCAVAAIDLPAVGHSLVAFFVAASPARPDASAAPSASGLRDFLLGRLPDHMVPTHWVALDELPLLPTGKIDRRALPALALRREADRLTPLAQPRPGTEEALAVIWREVLGLADVGVTDDFFELGGHSLLATQLLSRIQATLRVDVGLRALFETPTIAGLARVVDQLAGTTVEVAPVLASPLPAPSERPSPSNVPASPADVEGTLLDIWRSILANPNVKADDNFFDLGGHSLLATRLYGEIHDRFGLDLPVSTLFSRSTVKAQVQLILDAADDYSPLVPIQPLGAEPPFFLVHGIGGEVISFHSLARRIGTNQPIYGLRADERGEGDGIECIEDVAAGYVRAIRTVAPTGPYRIGGYSAGGMIAYEMAQQLQASGDGVALLVMLDAPAPGANPKALTPTALWRLARNLGYWPFDDEFLRSNWKIQRARIRGKINMMRARARHASGKGTSPKTDVRDRLGLWNVPAHSRAYLERYLRIMRAYRPQPYHGRVTVVGARTRSLSFRGAPDLGWKSLARGGVTTHTIPGAHDTILREPRVRRLAAVLLESLNGS